MSAAAVVGSVRVTNPDKLFWPDDGITKLDLVRYYAALWPRLRPWVQDRLLSLKRCPNGILGTCFHQKEKPDTMPPGTPTLDPGRFTLRTIAVRVRRPDPWADFFRRRQDLRPALAALGRL